MTKCARCNADLTEANLGDPALVAQYKAVGHPFLCNTCIERAIEGEPVCGDHLTTIGECGCKL